ncbi:hypothetical protein GCM10025786_05960 [Nocardioides caeni]
MIDRDRINLLDRIPVDHQDYRPRQSGLLETCSPSPTPRATYPVPVSDVLDEGPFFHGTKADVRVGDLLTSGFRSNYRPEVVMNHIYFTALMPGAGLAADPGRRRGDRLGAADAGGAAGLARPAGGASSPRAGRDHQLSGALVGEVGARAASGSQLLDLAARRPGEPDGRTDFYL